MALGCAARLTCNICPPSCRLRISKAAIVYHEIPKSANPSCEKLAKTAKAGVLEKKAGLVKHLQL